MDRHSQAGIVSLLEEVPLFRNLAGRHLKAIAAVCSQVHYAPGAVIFKELEAAQHLVILTSGTVNVRHGERTLATIPAGEVIGEMALIDGEPRSATVTAESEVDGIAIYRTAFRRLLDEHPTMCGKLLLAQTARLRELDKVAALAG
jgi:CRP/FNR family transcriptional regulator, cyclic AMP receptor protein